ncbi:hypothetical protein [Brachyspira murdochii]|uniref:hypothetical protein n=1 Tax=Brachyspira murdochii TaxID=84378 RepID=UPI0030055CE1
MINIYDLENQINIYANNLVSFFKNNPKLISIYGNMTIHDGIREQINDYITQINNIDDYNKKYNYIVGLYENLSRTKGLPLFDIPYINNSNNYNLSPKEISDIKEKIVNLWISFLTNPNNFLISNLETDIRYIVETHCNNLVSFFKNNPKLISIYGNMTIHDGIREQINDYITQINNIDDYNKKYNYIVGLYENLSRIKGLPIFDIPYINNPNNYNLSYKEIDHIKLIVVESWIVFCHNKI